jgi:hypothetical protein
MDNSGWKDYETTKPPKDSVVLVWLDRPILGSRVHVLKTNINGIEVVVGRFSFDLGAKFLCWKEIDSVIADVPMKYE